MTQYDKNCENYLTYMKAVKNVAQDVIHAYDTADEDGNVAWEIIEDIMEGLIAVYLDTFRWNDGKSEDLHKNLTESDMERDIDSLEERVDEIDENVEWLINEVTGIKEKIVNHTKQVSELTQAVGRLEGITQPIDPNSPILLNGTWHSPDVLKWGSYYTVSNKTEEQGDDECI